MQVEDTQDISDASLPQLQAARSIPSQSAAFAHIGILGQLDLESGKLNRSRSKEKTRVW